ncbi:MAG: NAD-dependent epimerase/dehydratase family protein [Endomicrobiaceae bacterium]|nr:NAD-dependent epimerase/dehydratase family protein [Endomicrobiaceae bacterium]
MNIKNILITGANGFIGRNLKEFLSAHYNLFTPLKKELNLLNSSQVGKYFNNNKIDFIINCASVGGLRGVIDSEQIVNDNLLMFDNLCENVTNQRMIFFGSGAQYDKNRDLKKIKESDFGKYIPKDYYGYSKYLITKKILEVDNILNLTVFGCYGKYELLSRFISYAINQSLKQEDIVINQNVVFDYLYIDDLCKTVEFFINNKPKSKIINVTPVQSIDLVSISNIVNEFAKYKSEIIIQNKKLNYEYTGDNSLLLQEINNLKFNTYEEGIKKLYSFYNFTTGIKI